MINISFTIVVKQMSGMDYYTHLYDKKSIPRQRNQ